LNFFHPISVFLKTLVESIVAAVTWWNEKR